MNPNENQADKTFRWVIIILFSMVFVAVIYYIISQIIWLQNSTSITVQDQNIDYVTFIFTVITLIVGLVGAFSVYNSHQARNEVSEATKKAENDLERYRMVGERLFDKEAELRDHIKEFDRKSTEITLLINQIKPALDGFETSKREIGELSEGVIKVLNHIQFYVSKIKQSPLGSFECSSATVALIQYISHPSPLIRMECVLALSQIDVYEPDVLVALEKVSKEDSVPEIRRIAQEAVDRANK